MLERKQKDSFLPFAPDIDENEKKWLSASMLKDNRVFEEYASM